MIDLYKQSGLELSLANDFSLVFNNPELETKPGVRIAKDMESVLLDKTAVPSSTPLYYMYRGIGYAADRDLMSRAELRYDITVMPFKVVGKELNKTKGHYHPKIEGQEQSYPEVYEVIYGQALYLIQKPKEISSEIEQIYLITASAGEKVVIPSGFGHFTINPGPGPLVMSNWASTRFESEYEEVGKLHGAGYYVLVDSPYELIANPNYTVLPDMTNLKPKEQVQLGLGFNKPMYKLVNDIDKLSFLTEPKLELNVSNLFASNIKI